MKNCDWQHFTTIEANSHQTWIRYFFFFLLLLFSSFTAEAQELQCRKAEFGAKTENRSWEEAAEREAYGGWDSKVKQRWKKNKKISMMLVGNFLYVEIGMRMMKEEGKREMKGACCFGFGVDCFCLGMTSGLVTLVCCLNKNWW